MRKQMLESLHLMNLQNCEKGEYRRTGWATGNGSGASAWRAEIYPVRLVGSVSPGGWTLWTLVSAVAATKTDRQDAAMDL